MKHKAHATGRPDTAGPVDNSPDDLDVSLHRPQMRKCLRCRSSFESAWNGERICRRCKNSGAWKNGVQITSTSKRDVRRQPPSPAGS